MPKEKKEKQEEQSQEEELVDGFIPYPTGEPTEPEETQEPSEQQGETEEKEQEPETEPGEKEETTEEEPTSTEPEKFTLREPDELLAATRGAIGSDEPGEDTTPIIYQGKTVHVTKDQLINLAQKGYDYDLKVGPHGKIAKMIEADPQFAFVVNRLWDLRRQGKPLIQPKPSQPQTTTVTEPKAKAELLKLNIKPLEDYDSEGEWLEDNAKPIIAAINQLRELQAKAATASPSQSAQQPVTVDHYVQMLTARDPEWAEHVLPKMAEYERELSVADYNAISTDYTGGKLVRFYDYCKKRFISELETGKNQQVPKPNVPETKLEKTTPNFRVRSGGGESPSEQSKANAAWDLSRDKFQQQLEQVKLAPR